jgi:acyl carrier protein
LSIEIESAPSSDIFEPEPKIAEIVHRLLHDRSIDREFGFEDNLRDVGLSSLDMTSLVFAIEADFAIEIPDRAITPVPRSHRSAILSGRFGPGPHHRAQPHSERSWVARRYPIAAGAGEPDGDAMAKLSDEQLRALLFLASHPNGCTEAVLMAHGFPSQMLEELVTTGLAKASPSPQSTRMGWLPASIRRPGWLRPAEGTLAEVPRKVSANIRVLQQSDPCGPVPRCVRALLTRR